MSRSEHLIETPEEIVRKRVLKSETDEQENWNQNDPRLTEKRTLKHQVLKKN